VKHGDKLKPVPRHVLKSGNLPRCRLVLNFGKAGIPLVKFNRLLWMLLAILMFLTGFLVSQRYPFSVSAQGRAKWEYQIIKVSIENAGGGFEVKGLNKAAEDGWEAVGMNESWVLLKRSR
jgi:hypothetical protein